MWLYVINTVKVTHQGEGHIKVKVKHLHPFRFYVAHTLYKRVVCIRLKYYLFKVFFMNLSHIKTFITGMWNDFVELIFVINFTTTQFQNLNV